MKTVLITRASKGIGLETAFTFIAWRASMSDEQWVDWNATNNEDWYKSVERDFGLNAR